MDVLNKYERGREARECIEKKLCPDFAEITKIWPILISPIMVCKTSELYAQEKCPSKISGFSDFWKPSRGPIRPIL